MTIREEIGSVEKAAVTIMVDNKADLIVESNDRVKYFTDKPLLAEHGFSALIQTDDNEDRILWDAGVSKVALLENMRRMKFDVGTISMIALSHGHSDHYTAMTALLNEMELTPEGKEWEGAVTQEEVERLIAESKIPIVAHPAAFRERWWKKDDGKLVGPFSAAPRQEWEAAGAEVILSPEPYRLSQGCWTTGYVPRKSFEKSGRPTQSLYREGPDLITDDLEEDQSIVIHVKGKGLIVLTGCAHSGIVNTVEKAKGFTGVDTVYAIIGGFHLAKTKEDEIRQTIAYFKKEKPAYIIPTHCTGFKAISQIARDMPDEFLEGVVGATYML